jgi:CHAD domain-containing protein
MRAKKLYVDVNSYYDALLKDNAQIGNHFDAKKIHAFRTNFKKLRAIFRWQHIGGKIDRKIKNTYELAGKMRNLQIAAKLMADEDPDQDFKSWLCNGFSSLKDKWNDRKQEKSIKKLNKPLSSGRFLPKKRLGFFRDRIREMRVQINEFPNFDDSIHNIRKLGKDIQYCLKYVGKIKQMTWVNNKLLINLKKINSRIGKYNDLRTVVMLLEDYAHEEDGILIDSIDLIREKWQRRKTIEKGELLKWLKSLVA